MVYGGGGNVFRTEMGVGLFLGVDGGVLEAGAAGLEEFAVLGDAAGDSFSPHAEAGGFHFPAHELDDFCFWVAGLFLDFIEGAAIFPCHAYDLVSLLFVHGADVRMDSRGCIRYLMMKGKTKICASCGRVICWRKRWEDCWDEVKFCSAGCRKRRVSSVDGELEGAILELLGGRAGGGTVCPSEVAREFFGENEWRGEMERVRRAARRLVDAGKLEILQRGQVVDASTAKGPIRLRGIRDGV